MTPGFCWAANSLNCDACHFNALVEGPSTVYYADSWPRQTSSSVRKRHASETVWFTKKKQTALLAD
jgi:hypothetical protein